MDYAIFIVIGWVAYVALASIRTFHPYGIESWSAVLFFVSVAGATLTFIFYVLGPFSLLFFLKRDSWLSLLLELLMLAILTVLIGYLAVGVSGLGTSVRGTTVYIRDGLPTVHHHIDNLICTLPAYLIASLLYRRLSWKRAGS